MKYLYIDAHNGASGDMLLAAIISCGADLAYIQQKLSFPDIPDLRIDIALKNRGGMACSHLIVDFPAQTEYRYIQQITSIIRKSTLSESVIAMSEKILTRLGLAEAHVHGVSLDEVHFHEIGAVDTIVDIVGFCSGLEYLNIDTVLFSPVAVGSGLMKTAHGVMSIPAPATAELLKGFTITSGPVRAELLTPTGAAILSTLGTQSLCLPEGTLVSTGVSCGTKIFKNHTNTLRAYVIDSQPQKNPLFVNDDVIEIETDIDHISGEVLAFAAEILLEEGALDVSYTPTLMKKGRPAYHLKVLCAVPDTSRIAGIIMAQTRTLGVRFIQKSRIIAMREESETVWNNDTIQTKSCNFGAIKFTKPEYESLARIARATKTPLIEIMEAYAGRNPST